MPNNSWNASRLTTTHHRLDRAQRALRGSLETSAASPNISPRCKLDRCLAVAYNLGFAFVMK